MNKSIKKLICVSLFSMCAVSLKAQNLPELYSIGVGGGLSASAAKTNASYSFFEKNGCRLADHGMEKVLFAADELTGLIWASRRTATVLATTLIWIHASTSASGLPSVCNTTTTTFRRARTRRTSTLSVRHLPCAM